MKIKKTIQFAFLLLILFVFVCCNHNDGVSSDNSKNLQIDEKLYTAKEKSGMIMLTDRAPNLETPLHYFLEDYTPNDVFFIRWHLSQLPENINVDTFRLHISGEVKTELLLTMNDLKTKFKSVELPALCCCAGNARSFFEPRVAGAQWKNGGMGNAKWKGVLLKDVLEMAGIKPTATEVAFNGLDSPPLKTVPDFEKSLTIGHSMDGEVMIAYEMNGESMPLLNGYPLKLVVPGWYATYWIGMLNEIIVLKAPYKGYWMEKAYKVPKDSSNGNENKDSLAKDLIPISKLDVRSIFVSPEPKSIIKINSDCDIQGLAFDCGEGISKVEISEDDGKTWKETKLDAELGKYSWRRWHFQWKAETLGEQVFKIKATNAKGETQPQHQWNRSGYMRNEIESITLIVK